MTFMVKIHGHFVIMPALCLMLSSTCYAKGIIGLGIRSYSRFYSKVLINARCCKVADFNFTDTCVLTPEIS